MSKLYIVPTPIGNLEDITFRAVKVLNEVDAILAEDTRKTGILIKHYNISKPLMPFHKFNEHKALENIVNRIAGGQTLALVSDAGTPGISDPGFLIVRECLRNNIAVETLPGATAFVPALVNSGLPLERFCFEGFLPQKKGRQTRLNLLKTESRTMVFYESPHRLVKTLTQLAEYMGSNRIACVSRELSKLFEENTTDTLANLIDKYNNQQVKGEIVIVVEGLNRQNKQADEEVDNFDDSDNE